MLYNDMTLEMFWAMGMVNRIIEVICFLLCFFSFAFTFVPFLNKFLGGKIKITAVFTGIYFTLAYGLLWNCSEHWGNLFLLGILSLAWLIFSMIYFAVMLRKKHFKQEATSAVKYDSEQDVPEKEGEADIHLDSQDPLYDQIVQMVHELAEKKK